MSDSSGLGLFVLVLAVILGGTGVGTLVGAKPAMERLEQVPTWLHVPLGITALVASVGLVAGRVLVLEAALVGAALAMAHYAVISGWHLFAGDRRFVAPAVLCVFSGVILALLIQVYAEVLASMR